MLRKLVFAIFFLFLTSVAFSQTVGIGFFAGSNTGLTLKAFTGEISALTIGGVYDVSQAPKKVTLYGDFTQYIKFGPIVWPIYGGLGVKVKTSHADGELEVFSVRGVLGMEIIGPHAFYAKDVEVFIEVNPSFSVSPSFYYYTNFAVGARYFFL